MEHRNQRQVLKQPPKYGQGQGTLSLPLYKTLQHHVTSGLTLHGEGGEAAATEPPELDGLTGALTKTMLLLLEPLVLGLEPLMLGLQEVQWSNTTRHGMTETEHREVLACRRHQVALVLYIQPKRDIPQRW